MSKTTDKYRARLLLPENPENYDDLTELKFYTKSGMLLAIGYNRVVIGERGPYIEFDISHILWVNTFIPASEMYRTTEYWLHKVFYKEHRSTDDACVKIYDQMKTVDYADYKVGMIYISPFDLTTTKYSPLITGS